MKHTSGFTLVELTIVIAIIGVLSMLGFGSYTNIQRNSKASKMASDFQQIRLAWKVWRNANDQSYPSETDFGTGNHPDLPCEDEPGMSESPVILYLEHEYNDPWDIEYSYDNDGDIFPGGGLYSGVNIFASWCAGNGQRYIDVAEIIDRSIDNGDGSTLGQVRWGTDPDVIGAIVFMISPDEDE